MTKMKEITVVLELSEWAEWIVTHWSAGPFYLLRRVRATGAVCYRYRVRKADLAELSEWDYPTDTPEHVAQYDEMLRTWAEEHCLAAHAYKTV